MTAAEDNMADVAGILAEAIAAVNKADVPAELREAALSKAVDVIVARRTAATGVRMGTAESSPESSARVALPTTDDDLLGRIANRLRLDREVIAEVYDDQDGKIDVIVAPRKLDAGRAPATKQLALLVTAARQGADIEEWTDLDEIRRLVDDFKRYDSANFAASIKEMDDIFRIKQSGRKISVKLGRPGWDRATELVTRLGGEE